jgi:hypothetical protein
MKQRPTLVPHVSSDADAFFENYYRKQHVNGIPVYLGKRIMRGSGFGSAFSGLFRRLLPTAKAGAMSLGKRALEAAGGIAEDLLDGRTFKASANKRLKSGSREILDDVKAALAKPGSSATSRAIQSGSGGVKINIGGRRKTGGKNYRPKATRKKKRELTLDTIGGRGGRSIFV